MNGFAINQMIDNDVAKDYKERLFKRLWEYIISLKRPEVSDMVCSRNPKAFEAH